MRKLFFNKEVAQKSYNVVNSIIVSISIRIDLTPTGGDLRLSVK